MSIKTSKSKDLLRGQREATKNLELRAAESALNKEESPDSEDASKSARRVAYGTTRVPLYRKTTIALIPLHVKGAVRACEDLQDNNY